MNKAGLIVTQQSAESVRRSLLSVCTVRCYIQERKVGRDKGSHKKEELLLADVGRGPHGGGRIDIRLEGKWSFK